MRRRSIELSAMILVCLASACSAPTHYPLISGLGDAASVTTISPLADAATGDTGASGGGSLAVTDGGTCAALKATTLVTQMQVAAAWPTVSGGSIGAGIYTLTAMNKYTGVGGATGATTRIQAQVMQLDGSTWQRATASPLMGGAVGPSTLDSGHYTAVSNTLSLTATCGGGNIPISYTATATELRLVFVSEEYVFERS